MSVMLAARPRRTSRLGMLVSFAAHAGVLVLAAGVVAPRAPEPPPREPEPILIRLPRGLTLPRAEAAPQPAPPKPPPPRKRPPPPPVVAPSPIVQPPSEALPEVPEEPEDTGEVSDEAAPEPSAPTGPAAAPTQAAPAGAGGADDGPLTLGDVSRPPQVLKQVTPEYPRQARLDRLEGLVLLRAIIGRDGCVERDGIRVVRGIPSLDGAAMAALRSWRFTPALDRQGRPVRVVIEIPFEFTLS